MDRQSTGRMGTAGSVQEDLAGQSSEPLKPSRTILEQEMHQAEEELKRPAEGLFFSGLLAGLGVGVSLYLIAVVHTLADGTFSPLLLRLLTASSYAIGFVIVILGRTDLFTEYTTMAILPVLAGHSSIRQLARLWGLVYVANLIGSAVFAALTTAVGPAVGVIRPEVLGEIARPLVEHGWWVILASSLIAGWMMGFLAWLVTAGRDTISQLVFVWLVAGAIGFAHLHHSITGTAEVLSGLFARQGITLADYGYFLFWTSVGNAVGGLLFAVLIWKSVLINAGGGARTASRAAEQQG